MPRVVDRDRLARMAKLGLAKYEEPEAPVPPEITQLETLNEGIKALAEAVATGQKSALESLGDMLKQQAEVVAALRAALARRERWTFTVTKTDPNGRIVEMKASQD